MVGKNGIPVLEDVECLDCMPVIEMEVIESLAVIEPLEVFYHPPAHTVAILHDVIAIRLAVMVVDFADCLVLYLATGEVMHFVVLCQGLCKMGCSTGKSSYALCIQRFPAEYGYLK
jgi:predicted ATP-grasp superfamily ATP-dependent carboligase